MAMAQPAAIQPPLKEGENLDEADLLQPDENENEQEQNKEEEIEAIGVDLLEEYSELMQMMR